MHFLCKPCQQLKSCVTCHFCGRQFCSFLTIFVGWHRCLGKANIPVLLWCLHPGLYQHSQISTASWPSQHQSISANHGQTWCGWRIPFPVGAHLWPATKCQAGKATESWILLQCLQVTLRFSLKMPVYYSTEKTEYHNRVL